MRCFSGKGVFEDEGASGNIIVGDTICADAVSAPNLAMRSESPTSPRSALSSRRAVWISDAGRWAWLEEDRKCPRS